MEKLEIDGVRVDPIDEILTNKLTAIVGRQEERDLVDVYFLEQAGHSVESALASALAKDGGCTPANLAWLLSQVDVPAGLTLPAPLTVDRLREYLGDLVKRLRRLALPSSSEADG
jgi:aryl-alcohol dehydrogenase-like predicted oxidoreductase